MLSRTRVGGLLVAASVVVVTHAVVFAMPVGAAVAGKGGSGTPEWLGSRTTDDGVTIRVTAAPIRAGVIMVNGVSVPASCFPDEQVVVGVSTHRMAEALEARFRTDIDQTQVVAPVAGQYFPSGGQTDRGVRVVIVRTPKGAATVRARALDWQDTVDVTGRYAVFAGKMRNQPGGARPSPRHRIVRLTVLDRGGKVIDRKKSFVGQGEFAYFDSSRPECNPPASSGLVASMPVPPPLPDTVGPPPADEAAAHEAVVAAVEGAYAAGGSGDASLAHVEGGDSAAVRAAQQLAASRNPQYRGKVVASVSEVKFLDDKEAAVRFDLRADGASISPGRVGFVVLTADGWKFSRSSYCALLSSGGGQC